MVADASAGARRLHGLTARSSRLNWLEGATPWPTMSDIRIQPQPVAIARVILLLVAATGIVLVLSWLLTGGGSEIFEPKSDLHSYMADASGLIVTAAVQL